MVVFGFWEVGVGGSCRWLCGRISLTHFCYLRWFRHHFSTSSVHLTMTQGAPYWDFGTSSVSSAPKLESTKNNHRHNSTWESGHTYIQLIHSMTVNNKTGRLTLRKTGSPKSLKLGDVAVRWMGCWTISMATHSTICAGVTKNIFTTHTYMILRHIFSHNRFFLSSVINTDYRSSLHSSKWFFVASISRFRNQERWVKRKIYFSGRGVD